METTSLVMVGQHSFGKGRVIGVIGLKSDEGGPRDCDCLGPGYQHHQKPGVWQEHHLLFGSYPDDPDLVAIGCKLVLVLMVLGISRTGRVIHRMRGMLRTCIAWRGAPA